MKKLMSLVVTGCMCFALAACGNQQTSSSSSVSETSGEETTSASSVSTSNTTAASSTSEVAAESTAQAEVTEAPATETTGSDTLVVYFSNTGNTRAIAESISAGLSADIYEIIAETPYTEADLDYGDDNSRSTVEMNDPSARPAIQGSVENMDQYTTVYIGYPIWWGEAPRILDTFVESYDFTDKTVIPFCTSSSSGMGSSGSGLAQLAGSGNWLDGQRFSGNESAESVMEWVNSL